MAKFKVDAVLHITGHMTIEANDENQATNDIMDGKYALSDLTIDGTEWEINDMQEQEDMRLLYDTDLMRD